MKRIIDKSSVSPYLKRRFKKTLKIFRILTSPMRLMPDFIIIGAQRSGTTSLYNYLIKHPYIIPAFEKETHFFDINFKKSDFWYRANFPIFLYKYFIKQIQKHDFATGEASPYYLFYPHAPKRIAEIAPQVKLIVLLRNPIDRAYSHYHHEVRLEFETLSFEEAIKKEDERLHDEKEKILEDESYYSFNHQHYSYLSRGIYLDQLKVWMRFFPKEQFLIIKSEDFYNDPQIIYKRVLKFLNLQNWELKEYKKYNYARYPKMNAALKKYLIDYFEPHNQRLYKYLGVNFYWDR